jgi:hypothetical protein
VSSNKQYLNKYTHNSQYVSYSESTRFVVRIPLILWRRGFNQEPALGMWGVGGVAGWGFIVCALCSAVKLVSGFIHRDLEKWLHKSRHLESGHSWFMVTKRATFNMRNRILLSSVFQYPGSITDQLVRCWILTTEPRVQSLVTSCEIRSGWDSAWNRVLFQLHLFPFIINIPSLIYTHLAPSLWGMREPWSGSTVSHPRYLSYGLKLWPGTWLVTERGRQFSFIIMKGDSC